MAAGEKGTHHALYAAEHMRIRWLGPWSGSLPKEALATSLDFAHIKSSDPCVIPTDLTYTTLTALSPANDPRLNMHHCTGHQAEATKVMALVVPTLSCING